MVGRPSPQLRLGNSLPTLGTEVWQVSALAPSRRLETSPGPTPQPSDLGDMLSGHSSSEPVGWTGQPAP